MSFLLKTQRLTVGVLRTSHSSQTFVQNVRLHAWQSYGAQVCQPFSTSNNENQNGGLTAEQTKKVEDNKSSEQQASSVDAKKEINSASAEGTAKSQGVVEKEGNNEKADESLSFLERFGNLNESDDKEEDNLGSFLERFRDLETAKNKENKNNSSPDDFLARFGQGSTGAGEDGAGFLEKFGNLDNANENHEGKGRSVNPADALTFARMRQNKGQKNTHSSEAEASANPSDIAEEISRLTEDKPYYPGQIYDPMDLVANEDRDGPTIRRRFLRRKPKPRRLIQTGMEIHPFNTWFLSRFISPTGKILSRRETGLSAKTQRKVSKAIKTSRALGLMPILSQIDESVEWDRGVHPYVRKTVYPENQPPYTYKDYIDPDAED